MKVWCTVSKWAAGAVISLLAIWIVTALFTNNIRLDEWSEALDQNVLTTGTVIRERKEGWAASHVGEFGLIGSRSEEVAASPKVLIWGDSFVEAFHVADSEKMHRQLNELLQGKDGPGGSAIAVGKRLSSVADYVFKIPEYESVLPEVKLHVIHFHSLEDTFPDEYPGARISLFLSKPSLHLERYDDEFRNKAAPAKPSTVRKAIYRYNLHFFSNLAKQLAQIVRLEGMRFAPGVSQPPAEREIHRRLDRFFHDDWVKTEPPTEAWRFLLRELEAVTDVPILFAYAPPMPTLVKGRSVLENPEKDLVAHFAEICREEGFGFVNFEGPFLRFYETTGRFPKGFHNTRPWEGHFNADGHRLAAGAIFDWIEQNRHVVYPD